MRQVPAGGVRLLVGQVSNLTVLPPGQVGNLTYEQSAASFRPDRRRTHLLALVALLLLASGLSAARADDVYGPQQRGDVMAWLEVAVAERGAAPGLAAATLVVTLQGPATLEAEPIRLGDATEAWKPDALASSWSVAEGRAFVVDAIALRQVKAGPAPFPSAKVRFRSSPGSAWEEVEWADVLEMRDIPPPEELPPLPPPWPWLRWLSAVALALTLAALLLGGWSLARRRPPTRPLSASQEALAELDRLEQSALPPAGHPVAYHTRLAHVVRQYLARRFGLPALEQTSAEVLAAARAVPELAPALEVLRAFFERCDLAKFAGSAPSPEECRQTTSLARTLLEQTTPISSPRSEHPACNSA
jgi:hypothetical protein